MALGRYAISVGASFVPFYAQVRCYFHIVIIHILIISSYSNLSIVFTHNPQRSKYPLLKPILTKFVEENNVPGGYRESGEFEILKMNWDLYKRVAEADPVPGAPYSRGNGQLGAIDLGLSPAAGGVGIGKMVTARN